MFCYAATVFVSAFLLFQVQPMAARFVLPWFGGTSLVWTTCMLFFQVTLVLGYAWAHIITRYLRPRQQWILHSLLMVAALATLPIRPGNEWKPPDGHMATFRVLLLLAISVGLPFLLVSTTGPLIQAWQSVTHPKRSPFRLFALSNAASLAALISYPLLYERYLTLDAQSWTWTAGFILFAVLVFISGYRFYSTCRQLPESSWRPKAATDGIEDTSIRKVPFVLWIVLPMLASVVLLATTNMMTQEIGAIPLLWIVPLSLYLLSFIICFDHQFWYIRLVFHPLFFGSVIFAVILLELGVSAPISIQVIGYSSLVFGASMCCHGELARLKPSPRHLTLFYLMVSIGGALGGVFVALIAPQLFPNYYEFPLGVLAAVLAVMFAYGWQVHGSMDKRSITSAGQREKHKTTVGNQWPELATFAFLLLVGLIVAGLAAFASWRMYEHDNHEDVLVQTRNEYGTLRVNDYENHRKLNNGRIQHGMQYKTKYWSQQPTTYYCPTSGLGRAIEFLRDSAPEYSNEGSLSFGAIGLGVGTICAWCKTGDYLCYYEINPRVVEIAHEHFTYLRDCPVVPEIRLGDARIQLELELARGEGRLYDVLIADAFSSDSIPVHLLTLESMAIYKQRLTDRGILAIHTSNRFLQLANVVHELANNLEMPCVFIDDDPTENSYSDSSWVLVTRNDAFINEMEVFGYASAWPDPDRVAFWTDNYASIMPLVKWDSSSGWWPEFLDDIGWKKEAAAAEPVEPK